MAMLLDAFGGKLVEKLTNVIEEKAIMVLGVKDELQRLRRRMERIARVLKDAERRRIRDETVKLWVDELKDLMYDAEDIIDLCMIQGTGLLQDDHHSQLPESSTTASTRVRCYNFPLFSCVCSVPFRYEIADKIKSLNDRLTEISEDKIKFKFMTSSKSNDANAMNEASYRQSSSLLEPDVVGWDIKDATKRLVELLVSPHEQKCCLFAIVGMGGIGKTTLAQQIYNNPKIKDAFVLCSWICVSKSFTSRTDLLKEIIRKTGGGYGESTTIDELQNILCDVLHGKSLFLVLDDIWDDNIWNDLIKNLIGGTTTKCRVLVTTRDRNTSVKMGAIHIHNVNKLPLDSGWELLCKIVFTNNDKRDMQRMKDIGMKIVEKCDGLPIAIKAIASVLVTKGQNRREWENVLNSDAWTITGLPEELQGALYLSYEALPLALKHCFLYCALYPRGRELKLEDLVCQWIAEDYIEAKGNASMEDVAKSYYMELICRSFLQPDPVYVDMSICTIHDLLRALAEFFVGGESFSGDPQEAQITKSKKLRHLTVTGNRESVSISHFDCLRSLRLWTPPSLNTQVIGNFKHLRLLLLNGDKIENIPDSIGDLVHLRLLDLERTCILNLPDSLGNLINLQFLLLNDCKSLHILPNSITNLHNLRWLRVSEAPLKYVPKGIGKLGHLHHVEGLIISDSIGDDGEEGCNLEELQMLEKLNYLSIRNLEKSSSKSASVLSNKTHLRELQLCCSANYTDGDIQQQETDKIVQVFDNLCPPPGLEDLLIQDFFGGQYPKWMSSSTSINTVLRELIYLQLINCSNCPHLPQLGQLPQLKYLKIVGATAVVSIGPEFLGNYNGEPTEIAFPKLESLIFMNMSNWEEWSLISGEEEDNEPASRKPLMFFPRLKSISIIECRKLKALPSGLNRVNIAQMFIRKAHSLSRVSHLPFLKELIVADCPMMECVEKLESLQSLMVVDHRVDNTIFPQCFLLCLIFYLERNNISVPQSLISYLEEINTSLLQWLISFLQQREENPHDDLFQLKLKCSAQALKGCLKGRPHWTLIQQVPRFIGFAGHERMYMKYTREPYYYETNITDED
ncbi:putative disease resistance protein RGA1 [Dioscorea cayenensis subsp. rotundata]|uniref:Disease resistance protein RGA1 n=1 Tax=Dioscorea cayennensis subsp. rotundata TaxID=55577 RepID=A0AB40B1G0_DIOCR|nr:putative disease resistance protein RGA1 [Dioscorea cayenensis subsp. rotundata]XP_039120589.1 putative disease resistance protein RGA1 [Dioscorea cayenensis subsp. rotundata]XP_039120590.1 putative disease resistance protein RGA1 [Dioscorea cayenensis subsp. rotundata]XP_039120591.1 putative disease resistance protein RGA1 [Dioscorea cayenensis subsp. rotundata]XP_039120592.1 putative disease resistance protein RGA1 [Dioscorea cayenensis subsp. rotundata]XP_039120594.1 putative disease res